MDVSLMAITVVLCTYTASSERESILVVFGDIL